MYINAGIKTRRSGGGSFDTPLDTIFADFENVESRERGRKGGESRSERVKRNRSRDTRVVPREFSRGPRGELSSLWRWLVPKGNKGRAGEGKDGKGRER